MQNKPNFKKSQMNVKPYNTTEYENKWLRKVRKNKPNSNPIKPNLKRAQMNVNLYVIEDYRKKEDFTVRINKPNSNPISEKPKMYANAFSQKDYENEPPSGPKKTNPNKPNLVRRRRISNAHKPIKGAGKKGYQELFLGLNCRKGYNIVLSKRKFSLVLGVYCDE